MSNDMIVKSFVEDYMSVDVTSVKPNTSNEKVFDLMKETGHDGFPVVDEEYKVVGIITAFDLLLKDWSELVKDVMTSNVIVARGKMSTDDASRVMFRKAISRLPVVDEQNKLRGIITNTDMLRSHIERTTPNKVETFKKSMEVIYGVNLTLKRKFIDVDLIRPSQDEIYADELEGRSYELEKGLAEPVIIAHVGDRYILVDGHHRATAAFKLGLKEIDAYVVEFEDDIQLGLERTADDMGIHSFDDISIIEEDRHPLIALTETIQSKQKNK
ncbi:CBS domain-containing ParB/RepB/Spo0J family partition protein [Methanobrevibacter curvatus]|nr:CBS domain-containing protein [Methanobrevibacter curvatus]